MKGPINFVFTIIWIAIGLSIVGTLQDCARTMVGRAVEAHDQQLSLGNWNRKLQEHR